MVKETQQIKRVKGFSNNGVVWKGQDNFETEYDNIEIRDRVKRTGPGEQDFIVEKFVVHTKTPIQEVVDADANSVGVNNIIKQVLKTGDTSLLPVDTGGEVDFVGAPETLMELKELGKQAEMKFKGLPEEITEGRDMASFVNNMSQEKFDSLMKAINGRASAQKEVKENE